MKIAITGSRGFIGSHLRRKLEQEHEIIEWDRDLGKDIKDFTVGEAEFVIHLAAIADVRRSIKYPEEYWENNVTTTTEIQRKCHFLNVPLLYASSSCVHNWWLSPYGTSKKANEETAFHDQVAMRFTTVYGDGARESMLIGKIANNNVKYLTYHIRDFIHVDDVVSAIVILMDKSENAHKYPQAPLLSSYDIGTGTGVKVNELGELFDLNVPVLSGDECEAHDNTADNQDLLDLGWKPTIKVQDYIASKIIPH